MLKELRATSGAPMMECKKALDASDNDLEKALDWLREHGAAKASSKVAGRETVEGLIGLASDGDKSLAIVQVASETDFASHSERFVQLVQDVTASVLAQDCITDTALTTEQLLELRAATGNGSVKDIMDDAIVAIRENLKVPSATKLIASEPNTLWVPYVHNKVPGTETGTAVAAVLVGPDGDAANAEAIQAFGKRLAMHIVAAKPEYKSIEDVPANILDKERAILETQIAMDAKKKPPEIVEKMVQGRLRKFYEQVCLTEQSHMIEEGNPKVTKALKAAGVVLHDYVYLAIGSA